jgi:hypothetical protein
MVEKSASTPLCFQERKVARNMVMECVSHCIHFSYRHLCVILAASLKCALLLLVRIVVLSAPRFYRVEGQ